MQRILEYFVKNKLLVNIIVIAVVMFGVYCVLHLQQDVMPQADLDMMRVTVTYPGASPSDVELNAIVPVEREVAKISGIREYTSLSLENGGTIENAQLIAAHESPRTTKLYDRTSDEITLDEVERIAI